jgi:hypothetical protein
MMYIDPNTGGIIFQFLAASFAALIGFLLLFSGRIRSAFARLRRRLRGGRDQQDEQEAAPPGDDAKKEK